MKNIPKYPPYPSSNDDYSIRHNAAMALRKPNKHICLYCHEQAVVEPIQHAADCPAKEKNV